MDRQPVVCHTCTGVLLAKDPRDYTPQRGRLIVANGYCACPSSAPPAPESLVRRQPHTMQMPLAQTTMVNA